MTVLPLAVTAQDIPPISDRVVEYSPFLNETFPNQVFFGDTHVHTSYSADAGMIGNTLGPDDAYRFAMGEEVTSSAGLKARLSQPLDFLVISDHAENLGLAPEIVASNPDLLSNEWGKMEYDLIKLGTLDGITKAFDNWQIVMNDRKDPLADLGCLTVTMWDHILDSADKFNQPGQFTALIGFEWTTQTNGANLHRNVVFRNGKDKANWRVPFSAYDSEDPEGLWKWMAEYEEETGGRVFAIPHGGNLSNGVMFDDVTLADKKPMDRDYAERRMKWEPLYEGTQMKGDSESPKAHHRRSGH